MTVDKDADAAAKNAIQEDFFKKPVCCLGFTAAALRRSMGPTAVAGVGKWTDFWARALHSFYDAMDLSTGDVEALHAAQNKLVMGKSGGGSSFTTFSAKCVNRYSTTQHEVATQRSVDKAAPGLPPVAPARPDARGGTTSGKHILHGEVADKQRSPVPIPHRTCYRMPFLK